MTRFCRSSPEIDIVMREGVHQLNNHVLHDCSKEDIRLEDRIDEWWRHESINLYYEKLPYSSL